MRIVVVEHLSLDGVAQAPARPDEDTREGFVHGGWAATGDDATLSRAMGEHLGKGFAWLFGRRSYDDMLGHWNAAGGPFRDGLNQTHKYVVSSRPDTVLRWPRSELITGDVPARVRSLRESPGGNLVVMGSLQLVQTLLPAGLVDELFLMVHPIVLGSGRRLFGAGAQLHRLVLASAKSTESGVVLATYRQP